MSNLPPHAVVLGEGGTFPVPLGGFTGWMRLESEERWTGPEHCSGRTRSMLYAALPGEEVVKMSSEEAERREAAAALESFVPPVVLTQPEPVEQTLEEKHQDHVFEVKAAMETAWSPEAINPHDPHGIPQHAPGAKNDAGKVMADLIYEFPRAMMAVAEVATYGARKYTRDGWQSVPDGEQRYRDAEARHVLKGRIKPNDDESGLPHEWHRLWNAIAALELKLRKEGAFE